MLTIQNFDKLISGPILQRGKSYYSNGAILDIGETEGEWTAEVEGSDIYSLSVTLKGDNEITECICDCPFDETICKHLVAMFFSMRDEIKKRDAVPKKGNTKNPFNDLLKKVSAQEYAEFVKLYASKNKDFKIAFEVFFAEKDDRIDIGEKYTELIKKLIKKFSSQGYVDYRSSSGLAKEISVLIDKGYELLEKKNYKDAFAVSVSILKEMMEVITFCDDSNGSIGGATSNVVELISSIADSADIPRDMLQQIFAFLQTELTDKQYFNNGDFGYDLFSIFRNLTERLNEHGVFLSFIDDRLAVLTGGRDDYDRNFYRRQKIDFLQQTGQDDKAEALIQQSLDIQSIRQEEVNKAIGNEDFTAAKKLINDGIKIAEAKQHPGTVLQWEKELLRIAILQNDLTLTRQYCKKFAFDRSSINHDYYQQWKATYKNEEWYYIIGDVIDRTIQKVTAESNKNRWASLNTQLLDALAQIYIEEKYLDRLFALVKNEQALDKLMRYHNYLFRLYPVELLKLYLPALEKAGDEASDRSGYAALADRMKKILTDIPTGKEQVIGVAQRLKIKYPRRPAMIDELNKLI